MSNEHTDSILADIADTILTYPCPCGEVLIDLDSAFRLHDEGLLRSYDLTRDRLIWIDTVTSDADGYTAMVCDHCAKHKCIKTGRLN